MAGLVVAALLSDIFDGVLARRWKCDTAGVRLFDTMADTVFYLCAAAALWVGRPGTVRAYAWPLGALLGLEAVRLGFDFVKFGRPASYHSYLAKTWGLVMAVGVVGLFAMHRANAVFACAMVVGIACQMEGLAMSLMLPVWRRDVKTLRAAWRLRGEMMGVVGSEVTRGLLRDGIARKGWLAFRGALVVALVAIAAPAFAVEPGQVAYEGGTAAVARDTVGSFDVSSPTSLVFAFHRADGSTGQIAIDYVKIRSYEYQDEVAHHLGVLAAIGVGLVTHRERRYTFTITYGDAAGVAQVAIFEVAKADEPAVHAVLRARDPQLCWNGLACPVARPPQPQPCSNGPSACVRPLAR
jgi:CDP-diacylglycerol--glycerol-3-phosphate 3-phosphatidyltransferase